MRPITKTAIAAGVAAVIWIGVHNMPSAGSGPTKPAVIEGTWPSPTPGPTEPPMIAAVSTPWQSPPMPLLWPSPPPPREFTEEELRDIVRKEMDDAFKRGQESERLKRAAEVAPVPPNPWESEEERALKARKRGFLLVDAAGEEWGRIHRGDNDDIVKGLFPETTAIESKARPVVAEKDGAFTVTFEAVAKQEAKP